MNCDQRVEYAQAVWEEFLKKRGREWPLMDSVDFNLICRWMDQGIPLRIVLRGLEDAKNGGKTLRYYENAVSEAIAYHEKAWG